MSKVNPPFQGYRPVGTAPAIANEQIQYVDVNLSTANINGTDLSIKGDWLMIETGSVGALRAQLTLRDAREVQSVLLVPGRVVNKPFNGIRVFNDQVTAEATGVTVPQPIFTRIIFGIGVPPSGDRSIHDGGRMLAESAGGVNGTALSTKNFLVTEGMLLDIWLEITQTTGAAETSILTAPVFVTTPAAGVITPDFFFSQNVTPAAVGTARAVATFRNIVIARGVNNIQLFARNVGNAATNNILASFGMEAR